MSIIISPNSQVWHQVYLALRNNLKNTHSSSTVFHPRVITTSSRITVRALIIRTQEAGHRGKRRLFHGTQASSGPTKKKRRKEKKRGGEKRKEQRSIKAGRRKMTRIRGNVPPTRVRVSDTCFNAYRSTLLASGSRYTRAAFSKVLRVLQCGVFTATAVYNVAGSRARTLIFILSFAEKRIQPETGCTKTYIQQIVGPGTGSFFFFFFFF